MSVKRTFLAVAGLSWMAMTPALAQTGNPGGAINDRLGAMDYGVCRGTDPKCFHDWPRAKAAEYRVLLYTRTAGPRHADLGTPLSPGLNPPLAPDNIVQREMKALLEANGVKLDYTEDVKVMARLNGYNAVIFFSTSRDNLDDGAKTALRQYMRAGGGFIGVHNAFGTLYNWPYYEGLLGGANFYDHGPEQEAEVVTVDPNDASTKALPKRWRFKDEWYNLVPFPTKVRFLATVDEKTYSAPLGAAEGPPPPRPGEPPRPPRPPMAPSVVGKSPGHGGFHPVAWCQYYDGGKAWVTTLGHDAKVFSASDADFAGAKAFQTMIVGAIKSVAGEEPFCR